MKNIISKISIYAAAAIVAALSFTACEDEPDRFRLADGKPVVYYVRPVKAAAADSLLTGAYMGSSVCLVGDNLCSVYKLLFNDQQAVLNNSYITDHTLLVDIPNEIPGHVTDLMYLINKNLDTVKVNFEVLVPAPSITSMSNEYAPIGSEATLFGDYFVDDAVVPLSVKVGEYDAQIKNFTKGNIVFMIPEGVNAGDAIVVETVNGKTTASFKWCDSRGMLFNFDDDPHPTKHGWHNDAPVLTDDTSLSGNYLQLGNGTEELNNDSWADGTFAFEYWPGGWEDPTYSEAPRLTDFVDFSKWEKMALKFEINVPASNPWSCLSMQLIVGGVDKISGGKEGVVDVDGVTLPGANNTYFQSDDLPRGLYTPWAATGSFDTAGEWITVTVPYSNFIYGTKGKKSDGSLSASDFTSLTIFVWAGGISGNPCKPIIKLDNIRAVPIK